VARQPACYLAPEATPSDVLRGRLLQTVRVEARAARLAKPSSSVPFWMWGAIAALLLFTLYTSTETIQLNKQLRKRTRKQTQKLPSVSNSKKNGLRATGSNHSH